MPIDWSYVAGFFDGEGTVAHRKDKSRDTYRLSFVNTNENAIDAIKEFIGAGRKYEDWDGNSNHSLKFVLNINPYVEVIRVAKAMLPYSIIKKSLLEEAIKHNSTHKYRVVSVDESVVLTKYASGATQIQIAKELSTTPSRIRKILLKHNVEIRGANDEHYNEHRRKVAIETNFWLKSPMHQKRKVQVPDQSLVGRAEIQIS